MTLRTGSLTVIDIKSPHGVGRTRNYGHSEAVKASLRRSLGLDEAEKQRVNAERAAKPGRVGQ